MLTKQRQFILLETKDIVAVRFELRDLNSEAQITTIVNNVENKKIIKSIGLLKLVNWIKSGNAEFFPAFSQERKR